MHLSVLTIPRTVLRQCSALVFIIIFLGGCQAEQKLPDQSTSERPMMSPAACIDAGGQIVGDIGDGRIHRPDYRCANGQPPLGGVQYPPDGPMPIEGAVCCGG